MNPAKVLSYKNKVNELYHSKGTTEDLLKECGRLYGGEKEGMECGNIELNEEEGRTRITLPHPRNFGARKKISSEEKDSFWRCAFCDSKEKSAQISSSAKTFACSPFFSQSQSAGAIREDEGFGFSQFVNPFEIDTKKLAPKSSLSTISPLLPNLHSLELQGEMGGSGGNALPRLYGGVKPDLVFMQFGKVQRAVGGKGASDVSLDNETGRNARGCIFCSLIECDKLPIEKPGL
eukprot:TRINITY_DN6777_c0_g1_i3.p1 TRINITY_DN6777_c0_g1~~TRINITY_DN6777_c0_g1_i3.p1  ORF type:complete len:234 (-),score=50.98 TRINITY_DN6777_c0_g1_i3:149-850(-)